MIKASYDEYFTLTAAVISDDGMVSGLTVTCEIWDENETYKADGPTVMTESTTTSGIYQYTSFISKSEWENYGILWRAYFKTPEGYTDGVEDIAVHDRLYELTEENRHYNLAVENVLVIGTEVDVSKNPRKLSDNVTNFVKTRIKSEMETTWSGAAEHYVYAWYLNVGDKIPYKMAERDPSEPAYPHYTGEV